MKHLAITTTLAVRGQQTQAIFSKDVSVAPCGAFKDILVKALCAMGIEEPHKIKGGIPSTDWASLPYILPGCFVNCRRISGTHKSFLRLPSGLVQTSVLINTVGYGSVTDTIFND